MEVLLGLVLWTIASALLLILGAYSIRNPDRRPLGMSVGTTPEPARMRLIGKVLVGLGLVAVAFDVWMVWMFVRG